MSEITTYQQEMLDKRANDATLSQLQEADSNSKVSIWKLWIYIVSFVANTTKELMNIHEQEVASLLDNQILVNLNFYRSVALAFRDGHTFDREALIYTGAYTDEQIETAKIVKRVSAQTTVENGVKFIAIKLATEDANGNLVAIADDPLNRIKDHLFINSPAGTNFRITSNRADELKLEVNVYIDTQILTQDGNRVDGLENQVIPNAIDAFFADTNFNFNGELVIAQLEDVLQAVEGVEARSAEVIKCEANYQVPAVFETVTARYLPYSGYYTVKELKVNYLVRDLR